MHKQLPFKTSVSKRKFFSSRNTCRWRISKSLSHPQARRFPESDSESCICQRTGALRHKTLTENYFPLMLFAKSFSQRRSVRNFWQSLNIFVVCLLHKTLMQCLRKDFPSYYLCWLICFNYLSFFEYILFLISSKIFLLNFLSLFVLPLIYYKL